MRSCTHGFSFVLVDKISQSLVNSIRTLYFMLTPLFMIFSTFIDLRRDLFNFKKKWKKFGYCVDISADILYSL